MRRILRKIATGEYDGLGGPQMSVLGDVLAPRGSLVLYGLQGGNQTRLPACACFQKNIQFFVHCIGNFTGKPELGIDQDVEAIQRALREINQLTADRSGVNSTAALSTSRELDVTVTLSIKPCAHWPAHN